jgi:hypothetical protein
MSARLWAAYRAFAESLDPKRGVAGPEELRRLGKASEWTSKVYAAEHALFQAENGTPGIVGIRGEYRWLTMNECDISRLLELCPDVVLDRYLAITSVDSGVLRLTEQEKSKGWWTADEARIFHRAPSGDRQGRADGKVAFSPRLISVGGLPNETHPGCCESFQEWYVFENPVPAIEMEVFVNWSGSRLYAPEWKWCADRLWEQLERLKPESYIADGTVFTFATRNAALFDKVLDSFSAT